MFYIKNVWHICAVCTKIRKNTDGRCDYSLKSMRDELSVFFAARNLQLSIFLIMTELALKRFGGFGCLGLHGRYIGLFGWLFFEAVHYREEGLLRLSELV